jgi:hypothetical protein
MPDTKSSLRRGLIENAGGRLKCALCGEPLHEIGLVSVATSRTQTVVTMGEVRTVMEVPPLGDGINGVILGMSCQRDHKMWLNVIVTEGTISVVTEWEDKRDEVER